MCCSGGVPAAEEKPSTMGTSSLHLISPSIYSPELLSGEGSFTAGWIIRSGKIA
jgi:hypothetical protein